MAQSADHAHWTQPEPSISSAQWLQTVVQTMPRRNRVDPWGDLHAVSSRGLFTGNRGCLVDETGTLARHHSGTLWITCRTEYRDWKHPLEAPRTWTPLFFLDDAVALAAGHRPCGLCRRSDYLAFQAAVTSAAGAGHTVLAPELNRMIAAQRHSPGSGLRRAKDRILWSSSIDSIPAGTVVLDPENGQPILVTQNHVQAFTFDGWAEPVEQPAGANVEVLTPPTSVAALINGFSPRLHWTAAD